MPPSHEPITTIEQLHGAAEAFHDRPFRLNRDASLTSLDGIQDFDTFAYRWGPMLRFSQSVEASVGTGAGLRVMVQGFDDPDAPEGLFGARWMYDEREHALTQEAPLTRMDAPLIDPRASDHVPVQNRLIGALARRSEGFARSVNGAAFLIIGGTEELTSAYYGFITKDIRQNGDSAHKNWANATLVNTSWDEAHHRGFAADYVDFWLPQMRVSELGLARLIVENSGIVGTDTVDAQTEFAHVILHMGSLAHDDLERPEIAKQVVDLLDESREVKTRHVIGRIEEAMQAKGEWVPEGVPVPLFERVGRRLIEGRRQALEVERRRREMPDDVRAAHERLALRRFARDRIVLALSRVEPDVVPQPAPRLRARDAVAQLLSPAVSRVVHRLTTEPAPTELVA